MLYRMPDSAISSWWTFTVPDPEFFFITIRTCYLGLKDWVLGSDFFVPNTLTQEHFSRSCARDRRLDHLTARDH